MTAKLLVPFQALIELLLSFWRFSASIAKRAILQKRAAKDVGMYGCKEAKIEDFDVDAFADALVQDGFKIVPEPCAEPDVEPAPAEDGNTHFRQQPLSFSGSLQRSILITVLSLIMSGIAFSVVVPTHRSAPSSVAQLASLGCGAACSENATTSRAEDNVDSDSQKSSQQHSVQPAISQQSELDMKPQNEEATKAVVELEQGADTKPQAEEAAAELKQEEKKPSALYEVPLTRHSTPVSNVGNMMYYRSAYFGTVHVGSPAIPYTVVFDTGSGHLVLPSTYCQSETCKAHRRYRRSASSTGADIDYDGSPVAPGQPRDQITVSFGTGEVTGVFVEDVVCMHSEEEGIRNESSSSALTPQQGVASTSRDLEPGCMKLRMIAATQMSEEPFKSFHFDGVLGLGLDGLSQAPEFNFVDVIAASASAHNWGGRTPHTFAVFLAEDAEEESKITFGGWDDDHVTEDLSWNPVLDPEQGHWTIAIKSLRIDNEVLDLCEDGTCKGVVDTGTSLLAVPVKSFPELYTLLKHPAHMEGHCHGPGPQLHIELETFTITLGPEDYARVEKSRPSKARPRWTSKPHNVTKQGRADLYCKPMLMSMDLPAPLGPKLYILGEPILRKYLSVYDAKDKRVGFARARHHSKVLPPDVTAAPKRELPKAKSMFDVFRWRKLRGA